jgi:hypothetical protein
MLLVWQPSTSLVAAFVKRMRTAVAIFTVLMLNFGNVRPSAAEIGSAAGATRHQTVQPCKGKCENIKAKLLDLVGWLIGCDFEFKSTLQLDMVQNQQNIAL